MKVIRTMLPAVIAFAFVMIYGALMISGTDAQVDTWATPVPVTPTPTVPDIDRLVELIIAILIAILRDIIGA